MGQSKQIKEFKDFSGGLVTDTTPLNRPENSTWSEENFQLNEDGSRQRRLGLNDHASASLFLASDQGTDNSLVSAVSSYLWVGAGGIANNDKLVVQVGNALWMNTTSTTIEAANYKFPTISSSYDVVYSFANIDGKLVVATGEGPPSLVTWNSNNTVTVEEITLRVRDTFGEYDTNSAFSGDFSDLDDLLSEGFLNERPSTIARSHEYNLRNQGWGRERTSYTTGRLEHDPIKLFKTDDGNYPSNADSVVPWLKTNPNAGSNSFVIRFDSQNLSFNPPANRRAPYGSFVIDLLSRGQSRATELARNNTVQGFTSFSGSLSTDKTIGGPRLVAEFAGRVWYGGFPDEVTGSTPHTPHLPSYIAYSQSVEKLSQAGKCFQEGDPTHEDEPDLIDTDGGIIRIAGLVGMKKMVSVGDSLAVFADNGVWMISGGDTGFTANTKLVTKISEEGARGVSSIVEASGIVYYLGEYGVFRLARNPAGQWFSELISARMSTYFKDEIIYSVGEVSGIHDTFFKKIKWLFSNEVGDNTDTMELVYHLHHDCFTINRYPTLSSTARKPIAFAPPITNTLTSSTEDVTDGGVVVTDSGVDVTSGVTSTDRSPNEPTYLYRLTSTGSSYSVKSASPTTLTSRVDDWDDSNYRSDAFMYTAPFTMPENARRKTCPYVVFNFDMHSTGTDEGGFPIHSSCQVYTIWNHATGGSPKLGTPFQAYRNPSDRNDLDVLATRSKVRGRGRALSFLITSETDKYIKIYGWGLDIDTNEKL